MCSLETCIYRNTLFIEKPHHELRVPVVDDYRLRA